MNRNNNIKKIIFSSIIILSYIASFIFSIMAEQMYLNSDSASTNLYQTYVTVDYFVTFALSTPFFIIIILFFRQHKDLMIFSIISIIASLAFVLYNSFIFTMEPSSTLMKTFAQLSYFGAIINLFISFKIILQEKYDIYINRSFFLFAVINYGFFSFYTPHIKMFIALFVGPYPHFLRNTFMFYDYSYIFFQVVMVVVQVLIVINFIDNKVYNRKRIY